jgi:Mg-chelatase subunit ChlI
MNPEEGDLRPQLLDRFGLCVRVAGLPEKGQRMDVLRRRADFDDDPTAFAARWQGEQEALARRIVEARERLAAIALDDAMLERIVAVTSALRLDGHRGDIVVMKAARALAAFNGASAVGRDDVRQATFLALPHRQKRLPFDEMGGERAKLAKAFDEAFGCA